MEYKISPWEHQRTAIERAKSLQYFALFFEMGAGKSMTVINILRHKMVDLGRYARTIVFCPPIVVPNWKQEFLMNSKIPEDRIIMLTGSGEQRLKTFKEHAFEGDKPRAAFFITNYETLLLGGKRNLKKKYIPGPLFQAMQEWQADALVFDESHRLKSHDSQRSILAEILANPRGGGRKPLTYLLSGSPVLNSPMDLFHPFKIMDGGETFGRNFVMFRARFFVDKNAGMDKTEYFPNWVVKPGAVEEINRLIFRHGMRVTKKECMDLPDEVAITRKCKMTPLQLRNYKELKRELITYVGDKSASVTLAIVKALRLMQITSGFLPLNPLGEENDAAKVVYPKTEKEEHLKELLTELAPHSKVIVWAVWRENYASIRGICAELGFDFVEVHGGISGTQKNKNVERFKTDPTCRIFIGHPGSGGIGINLTCAPYSIFYSRTFSLEHWLQARARNHRGGQTEKVTHYDLVVEGTIDELVQSRLASKFQMSEDILDQSTLVKDLVAGMQAQSL